MLKTFYITTTLPYVNSDPHVGFALEIVHADIIARYKRTQGDEVFFNTGTDEHGLKIYRSAEKEEKDIQVYVDEYAARFKYLKMALNLSYDNFIRTTDSHHVAAAQEFWKKCYASGDIYLEKYKVRYCVGCELEKTESELENGCCPIHPNLAIETIEEENYFFRFSKYQEKLLKHYNDYFDFVIPDYRFNEIKAFVERGLEDFSISRLKSKMPWGVSVPDDPNHVMYVWFDALVNYISAIGWPRDMKKFEKWWPVVQVAGKDNLRQQAAMWQAMLMSAGIEPSKQIVIHGFITSGGQKMSKSLGNVIDPLKIVNEYGADALRYYLARHVHPFEDSDFTEEKFKEAYNANLANGLGNLVARIMKMFTEHYVDHGFFQSKLDSREKILSNKVVQNNYKIYLNNFELYKALNHVWRQQKKLDEHIERTKPFKTIKTDKEAASLDIIFLTRKLWRISILLEPFMPDTAEKIQKAIKENKMPEPLFVRK